MADKNKPVPKAQAQAKSMSKSPPPKPKSSAFKKILIFFMLLILLGAGFAAGVYLNVIDLQKLNHTYKLYDYPFLSKYFPKPQTNFETIPLEEQPSKEPAEPTVPAAPPQPSVTEHKETDKLDLERELKIRQQEEQKKLSKLARLYGAMKPDEAVIIMNQLDDQTVLAILSRMEDDQVAKILALLEAKRAAQLTQEMLKVKPATPGRV